MFLQGVANAHNLCHACMTLQQCVCARARGGGGGVGWVGEWMCVNREHLLKKGCLGDQSGPLQTWLSPFLPRSSLHSPPSLPPFFFLSFFFFKGASLMQPKVFQQRHFSAGRVKLSAPRTSVVFFIMSRICAAACRLPPSTSKEERHFSVFEGYKVGRGSRERWRL